MLCWAVHRSARLQPHGAPACQHNGAVPPLLLIAAAAAGVAVGWGLRRWLRGGAWRLPDEVGRPTPALPWEPAVVAVLWPLLLVRLEAGDHRAAWPAVAVLVLVGVALTAIDLAVHRLPDLLTLGALPVVLALLLGASALEGDWHGWTTLAWAVGVGGPIMLLLGLGGLGLGDVKLGVLLLAALGWFGTGVALIGLLLGFILGGAWAGVLMVSRRATRKTHFAYGPWMLLGALVALLVQPT